MPHLFDGEDDGLAMERYLDASEERERPTYQRPPLDPRGSLKQRFAPDAETRAFVERMAAPEPQLSLPDLLRRIGGL